jgi:hypothetical protein
LEVAEFVVGEVEGWMLGFDEGSALTGVES